MYSFIAQAFGIIGMTMNVLSYQAKSQKSIISVQLFGSLFFSINMFMIGGGMGCLLNVIAIFRAITYSVFALCARGVLCHLSLSTMRRYIRHR